MRKRTLPQLEHIEVIEKRLWGAADNLREIHEKIEELNIEVVSLAATIKRNFEALI